MERLTQINGNNEVYCIVDDKKIVVENIDMLKICQRLKLYEDLDEQGLLLRLPTEAYFIKDNIVCKGWVQELVYSPCRKLLLDIRYDDNSLDSYRGYVGNTVFLTQEEAERKLRENGIAEQKEKSKEQLSF